MQRQIHAQRALSQRRVVGVNVAPAFCAADTTPPRPSMGEQRAPVTHGGEFGSAQRSISAFVPRSGASGVWKKNRRLAPTP